MIISASRRTDIPAFYTPWFINRVRAGYCHVPNPFNRQHVQRISLSPQAVEMFVFWTRYPRPLFSYLNELDERGYHYYFQYTLVDYPGRIDRHTPALEKSLAVFCELAERVGPQRVIWRYDPIVFSQITPPEYHLESFAFLAQALKGYTRRSVISILTPYKKIKKRLEGMARQGAAMLVPQGENWSQETWFPDLMRSLVTTATANGMELVSCAMELDLAQYGVRPGKCIDDGYILATFGLDVSHTKDPGQRKACGCVLSRDIGMYDSCLFGCQYCYATGNFERSRLNHAAHDPQSPSLLGWYEPEEEAHQR